MDRVLRTVNNADAAIAAQRVADMRAQQPEIDVDVLVERLIKQKAVQTGLVGAGTASAAMIPGAGTVAAIVLGTAADVGVTMRLHAELVLEIAAARGHDPSPAEWRNAIMLVSGFSVGAEQLMLEGGRQLARKAMGRFAGRGILKALPVVGVVASGGANVLATYVVGKRADAYFSLGPGAMQDPSEILRAVSGVDERKLVGWTAESARSAGSALRNGAAATGRGVLAVGSAVAGRLPRRGRDG